MSERDLPAPSAGRSVPAVPVSLALAIGVVLGYLGWSIPTPGGSVIAPTLVVFGIGAGIAGLSWVAACFRPHRCGAREPTGPYGIPSNRCRIAGSGRVGPLGAPFRECATSSTFHGRHIIIVRFSAPMADQGSIVYTNVPGSAFPDGCYRHLTGAWWMTTLRRSGTDDLSCPFGYRSQGVG